MSPTPADSRAVPSGRIAIVLSAGYFGFFAHAGFMRAVDELGIDYHAISGSSAGAIVAALHASGVPASQIIDLLLSIRRRDFWDGSGLLPALKALVRSGRGWTGLIKGDLLEGLMDRHLRVTRFELCPRSLYVTAFNLTKGTDETFYSGTIADKVRASCSYPFLLPAKVINGSAYWDGGFLSKVPIETITWVVPVVPPISPRDFSNARAAIDAAYEHAMQSLPTARSVPRAVAT